MVAEGLKVTKTGGVSHFETKLRLTFCKKEIDGLKAEVAFTLK